MRPAFPRTESPAQEALRLSASQIKQYLQCPRQYYLERVARAPREAQGYHAWAGSVTHAAIYLLHGSPLGGGRWEAGRGHGLRAVLEALGALWRGEAHELADLIRDGEGDKYTPHPEAQGEKVFARYRSMVERYVADGHVEARKVLAIEREMRYQVDGLTMLGYIDLLVELPSGVYVVDLKTVRNKPRAHSLAYDEQMQSYAYAYRAAHGSFPRGVIYHHLESGNVYRVEVGDLGAQIFSETARQVARGIELQVFPRRLGDHCRNCLVRRHCLPEEAFE